MLYLAQAQLVSKKRVLSSGCNVMNNNSRKRTIIAIAWCLAWSDRNKLEKDELDKLQQMRQALHSETEVPQDMQEYVTLAEKLYDIDKDYTPQRLIQLQNDHKQLWEATVSGSPIGLVFGGATKIKQYVFEATKLNDIRGASALLDRINLDDIPGFFGRGKPSYVLNMAEWLDKNDFAQLKPALIEELIIYSTGGNILAFCPAGFVDQLANAIEKRYTYETLTANSCAVGDTFRLLEFRFGLLQNPIEETLWLDGYLKKQDNPIIKAYFNQSNTNDPRANFWERKNFNELVGKLANQFTQRRNGNDLPNTQRPSRAYPPMFETHPFLKRDETDTRSTVASVDLPGNPSFSAPLARKVIVGQLNKRDRYQRRRWHKQFGFRSSSGEEQQWNHGTFRSWVSKFIEHLYNHVNATKEYREVTGGKSISEAFSLRELGNVSNPRGFVGYIYADGNNMGSYIRKHVLTPQKYQEFSDKVLYATQKSVYAALQKHLPPRQLKNLTDPDNIKRNGQWIYPFEIVTIGGDDVMLIVPADKVLDVAKTIGEEFEARLFDNFPLHISYDPKEVHRYKKEKSPQHQTQCELSMSAGVLIASENTPIYYAEKLTNQLLKSSKKRAKDLKRDYNYYGGTVDFLVLKAVTMIASNISDFREQGLTKGLIKNNLKLYAAPYTLYELEGLQKTVQALKKANFPKSQIYQIRSLLESGKHTAILNYRYFRLRLQQGQAEIQQVFEKAWCDPIDESNKGNLAPWMSVKPKESDKSSKSNPNQEPPKIIYETIWRDLVDLYFFIVPEDESKLNQPRGKQQESKGANK